MENVRKLHLIMLHIPDLKMFLIPLEQQRFIKLSFISLLPQVRHEKFGMRELGCSLINIPKIIGGEESCACQNLKKCSSRGVEATLLAVI